MNEVRRQSQLPWQHGQSHSTAGPGAHTIVLVLPGTSLSCLKTFDFPLF